MTESIHLESLITASAPYVLRRDDETFASLWPEEIARRHPMLGGALGIQRRSITLPVTALAETRTVDERNALYARHAVNFGERVTRRALKAAGATPADVEVMVVASSTGQLVPPLDAHLAQRLGLPRHVRSITLTGSGCSGAVRGMGVASSLWNGAGDGVALVVAVELCSLWLPQGEISPDDLAAALTFGDGAGAVVMRRDSGCSGPTVVAHQSALWPESLDARGAILTSSGWRHRLSPRLGRSVVAQLERTVADFLSTQNVRRADLALIAMNPSEQGLMQVAGRILELSSTSLAASTRVWEEHGNTLAVGPLHVLRTLGHMAGLADGALMLLVVLGPGITCDLLLVRWHGGLSASHLEGETGS